MGNLISIISAFLVIFVIIFILFNNLCLKKIQDNKTKNYFIILLLIATFIKYFIFFYWYNYSGGIEVNPSVSDQPGYIENGLLISKAIREFDIKSIYNIINELKTNSGYSLITGLIYFIFGYNDLIISIFNIFFTILLSIFLFDIVYENIDKDTAKYTFILTLFYPQFISASYFILKDCFLNLFTIISFWIYFNYKGKMKLLYLLIFLLTISLTRFNQAILFVYSIVISEIILLYKSQIIKIINRIIIISLIFIFTIYILSKLNIDISNPGISTYIYNDEQYFRISYDPLSTNINLINLIKQETLKFIKYYTGSLIRIFYGPFYIYSTKGIILNPYYTYETPFRAIIESLSGIYIGILIPSFILGIYYFFKNERKYIIAILIFSIIFTFYLPLIGNVYRWRLPVIPFIFIFSSIGFKYMKYFKNFIVIYFIIYILLIGNNATNYIILKETLLSLIIFLFLYISILLLKKYFIFIKIPD